MIYRAGCLSCRAETALGAALVKNDDIFTENQLYWIGYLYRYWHYYTGESSREIYRQAPVCTMKRNYCDVSYYGSCAGGRETKGNIQSEDCR